MLWKTMKASFKHAGYSLRARAPTLPGETAASKALSPLQCLKADQRAAVVSARAAGKLVRVDSSEIGGSEASRTLTDGEES